MRTILFFILLCPLFLLAQSVPTRFEHDLNWTAIKAKAKKEGKYVFVDCFTTWCGPCKYIGKNVFTQPKVAAFLNQKFINLRLQFDRTTNDSEEVKRWYPDAAKFSADYHIWEYPTFLIFSPDGEMLQKIAGSSDAADFIKSVKDALNPETQYTALFKRYTNGYKGPELLKALTYASAVADDKDKIDQFASEYLANQPDLYTKSNLEFIENYTSGSKSKGFEILLKNMHKADSVMGPGKAAQLISAIVIRESILPLQVKNDSVDFQSLASHLKAKYPTLDFSKSIHKARINYYQLHQNWADFYATVSSYLLTYAKKVTADELNSFSWSIFEGCDKPAYLAKALQWSKKSVDMTQSKDATFLDTYANLLYKDGRIKDALVIENNALSLAPVSEKQDYQSTISKMKKGKKTW